MNTTELIHEVARRSKATRTPLTREQTAQAVDLLLDLMREQLSQPDGEVRLKSFCTIRVVSAVRRTGNLRHERDVGAVRYYRLKTIWSRQI